MKNATATNVYRLTRVGSVKFKLTRKYLRELSANDRVAGFSPEIFTDEVQVTAKKRVNAVRKAVEHVYMTHGIEQFELIVEEEWRGYE